jgi:hypothetical protein
MARDRSCGGGGQAPKSLFLRLTSRGLELDENLATGRAGVDRALWHGKSIPPPCDRWRGVSQWEWARVGWPRATVDWRIGAHLPAVASGRFGGSQGCRPAKLAGLDASGVGGQRKACMTKKGSLSNHKRAPGQIDSCPHPSQQIHGPHWRPR